MEVFTDSEEDSEEDSLKQELENALYAQIHFEENTECSPADQDDNDKAFSVSVVGNSLTGYKAKRTTSDIILNRSIGQVDDDDDEDEEDVSVSNKKLIDSILERSGADFDDDLHVELQALDSDIDSLYGVLDEEGLDDPGILLNVTGKKKYRPLLDTKVPEDDKWKINLDDIRQGRAIGRYHKRFRCHNCNEEGHLSKNCPKPKKEKVCSFCSEPGHFMHSCPNSLCYNCDGAGHDACNCPCRKRNKFTMCFRCRMTGHEQQNCPDLWRQYHKTISPGRIIPGKRKRQSTTYCYNCAGDDHLGHQCPEEQMNKFVRVTSPFVCRYDRTFETYGVDREGPGELSAKRQKIEKTETETQTAKNMSSFIRGQDEVETEVQTAKRMSSITIGKEKMETETQTAKRMSSFIRGKGNTDRNTGRNNFDKLQFKNPKTGANMKHFNARGNSQNKHIKFQDEAHNKHIKFHGDDVPSQDIRGSDKDSQNRKTHANTSLDWCNDMDDFQRSKTFTVNDFQSRLTRNNTEGNIQKRRTKFSDEGVPSKLSNDGSSNCGHKTFTTSFNGFRSRFAMDVSDLSISVNKNQSNRHVTHIGTAQNIKTETPKKQSKSSRKRANMQKKLAEEEAEPEEFQNHQVHNNEWWNKSKKRKRRRNKVRPRKV